MEAVGRSGLEPTNVGRGRRQYVIGGLDVIGRQRSEGDAKEIGGGVEIVMQHQYLVKTRAWGCTLAETETEAVNEGSGGEQRQWTNVWVSYLFLLFQCSCF